MFGLTQATGRVMEPGHRIEVVRNGAVFDALEALIASARKSLHLVMYIWKPGRASDRVLQALEERRRAGVAVRVVVDHWGSRVGFSSKVRPRLEAMGCEVRVFRPLGRSGLARTTARTHRKIAVADGQRALTGGFCIWDTFLGNGDEPEAWRDTNLQVEGPAVRYMQQAFLQDWRDAGGGLPPLDQLPWPVPAGELPATFVDSSASDFGGTRAQALVKVLIPAARQRLWISSAYFAPEPAQVDALIARARAGAEVRLLVAGPIHDVPPIREAGRATYRRLLEAGVRIWEYQPSMLHAKTVVLDDDLCVIGSLNLEPLSLNLLREGSVVFRSREIAEELSSDFAADLTRSKEITLETIPSEALQPARSLVRRAGTWVIHRLRDAAAAGSR